MKSLPLTADSGVHVTSVRLSDIIANKFRFEATNYSVEAREAVEAMKAAGHALTPLYTTDENGLATEAHNAFRFRRIWVKPSRGVPFLSSSEIISVRPRSEDHISRVHTPKLDKLLVKKWDVLLSCSGTIGNVALAGDSIAGKALSQDAIRVRTRDPHVAGYVAAFLRTRAGRAQVRQATYGSVIVHIEPHHLERVLLPTPDSKIISRIGKPMCDAATARDGANALLDQAEARLHSALGLPPPDLDVVTEGPFLATVRASHLQGRFDATFHNALAHEVEAMLAKRKIPLAPLGDPRFTSAVRAVTKFRKRVYVREGGLPLLSSRQVFQIDPIDLKGLAPVAHKSDLPEIQFRDNEILVTCSGTTGRVMIVPKYMAAWAGSQDLLRIDATSPALAGFLYAWLSSAYGNRLVSRLTYGSVVLHIDRDMIASVPVPEIEPDERDAIGHLVLRANELRNAAWQLERGAIQAATELAAPPSGKTAKK